VIERPAIHSYRFALLISAFQKTIPLLSGLFFMASKHIKKYQEPSTKKNQEPKKE